MTTDANKIKHLENMSLAYNITGGISIGVIIILLGAVTYLFIHVRKITRNFEQKMGEFDRLSRFTIKRPQMGQMNLGDSSLVQNRFRTSEMNFPNLFDTSASNQHQQYAPQNNSEYRPDSNHRQTNAPVGAHNARSPYQNSPKSDSFLHKGSSDREGPVFGNW